MFSVLHEISLTKKWMMPAVFLHAYQQEMQSNIHKRVSLDDFKKKTPYCFASVKGADAMLRMDAITPMSMRGQNDPHHNDSKEVEVDSFVAVIPVCGPITRNGGACSYGSIDTRDMIMAAASDEDCKGIVIYINSEGGSCYAIPDYKYGIEYAHQQGKQVFAFIDGLCASCGMYLASMCDKRYYMNPLDQVGSIGVMAAFWTNKDGDKDKYTDATYHELYATKSTHKNKWYRDAAKGDYKELQDDLDKTCEEFHADIKAACPNVKDVHLTGELFNAKDVEGILVDGQNTLMGVINEIIASATVPDASASGSTAQTTNTTIDMTNYPLTQAALGVEELAVNEEGTFINAALLDTMEQNLQTAETAKAEAAQKLADAEKALADAQAHAKEIEEQLATAQADKESADKALADAQEAHSKEIAELNANLDKVKGEHTEAIAKKDEEIATLTSAKAEADEALKGAKEALATAEQTIADKDAQIAELSNDPGNEPAQGAAPQNNGEGAQVPEMKSGIPQFDPANPVESKAAIDAYLANVRKG